MVRRIYNPSNKLLKRYTHAIWKLISNILSFNITHIKRDLNLIVDGLLFLQLVLQGNYFMRGLIVYLCIFIVFIFPII
jgi:hypothetical protein